MKTLAIALCAFLASYEMSAQVDTTKPEAKKDTAEFVIGNTEIRMIQHPDTLVDNSPDEKIEEESGDRYAHFAGVDVGFNMLLNADNKTTLPESQKWLELDPAHSLSWRINFYEQRIPIVNDYVGLVTGLGLTYNSYGFKNNTRLVNSSDSIYGVIDSIPSYSKNKLRATYLQLPLMLEFNTSKNDDKNFHLAAGVLGGWKIGSITRQEYELNGAEYNVRSKDDYNLTPWTLDATARIGYRNFTIWATYGLTNLFQKGKGVEVHSTSIGITMVPFN